MLVASIVKKPEEILDLSKEEMDIIKDILLKTSEDQLTLLLSELLKAEIDVRNASSPSLAFEMSLIKASFLSGIKPLKELMENIETYIKSGSEIENSKHQAKGFEVRRFAEDTKQKVIENKTISAEQRLPDEKVETVPSQEPAVQESLGKQVESKPLTDEIMDRVIKKMALPLASKISTANFKLVGDKLVLTLNGGDSLFADSIKKNIILIEQIFSEELGSKIKIEVETVKKKTVRKKDLKEEVMADPAIKEVLELFEGRIVDVIPKTEDRK
jgi:DNA polymerase III gamma/tau subunit